MRCRAAAVLIYVAKEQGKAAKVVQAGAVEPLASLFGDADAVVRHMAAAALWNIAVHHLFKRTVAVEAVLPWRCEPTTAATCEALAKVALHPENLVLPAFVEAIRPLVGLLRNTDPAVRFHATRALATLMAKQANHLERIMQLGALEPLVAKLSEPETGFWEQATLALGYDEPSPKH